MVSPKWPLRHCILYVLFYLLVDRRSVDTHITEYARSCTKLLGRWRVLGPRTVWIAHCEQLVLDNWSFAVLIERFRKVSSNSLTLVATHLLEHGANE